MKRNKQLRHSAAGHVRSRRRGRTMAFESLDMRTVLSAGSMVAAPWMPPMNQFGDRDAGRDFMVRDAGRSMPRGSADSFAVNAFSSPAGSGPIAGAFGAPMGYGGRGPSMRG